MDEFRRDTFSKEPPIMALPSDGDRPPRRRWSTWAILMIAVVLVIGPIVYFGAPREIARWYIAAAMEKRLDGDLEGAVVSLEEALKTFPDSAELHRYLATWRMELGRYDAALEAADRAVELNPHDVEAYMVRSQILQHLKQHDRAIADWDRIVELAESQSTVMLAMALNGRAYACALGNRQLDQAWDDIQRALAVVGDNAAMLDTRGFLAYVRGDMKEALPDMERAVPMIEQEYAEKAKRLEDQRRGVSDPREYERELRQLAESVAVIRYHRALVLEQLGETERAESDRARVRELGFEPGESLF